MANNTRINKGAKMKIERMLNSFVELHLLTKIPRTGWILAGVSNPESVSDHCYETALFAYMISKQLDFQVDIKKVLLMALFHEVAEARITDLPRRSKDYIGKAKRNGESQGLKDILYGLNGVSEEISELLEEMHEKKSPEARLVEAAEELQIIFKALVYAKENRGDMSEYKIDVSKYDSLGIEPAEKIAKLIGEKLDEYLGKKPYWAIGYEKQTQS